MKLDATGKTVLLANLSGKSNDAALAVVSIWATGVLPASPAVPDGQIAQGANDFHCCGMYTSTGINPYTATLSSLKVFCAGAAPGTAILRVDKGPTPYASDTIFISVKP